jgi:uncharacterized protein (TIGR00255 family)
MIYSMTAFAREQQHLPWGTMICEIRSVNQRYLDASFKLPEALRELEIPLRDIVRKRLGRGKVECAIRLNRESGQLTTMQINPEVATQLHQAIEELSRIIDAPWSLSAMDLLKWPGIMQDPDVDGEALNEATVSLFTRVLDKLLKMRMREGGELKELILSKLVEIDEIIATIRARMPEIVENHRLQLTAKVSELVQEIDHSRLEQEMVFLAQKVDVEEELDRLSTHIEEVKRVLAAGGTIGRRLDFLMQELNREANTLSSKAVVSDTSLGAVDLKVLIEQMREQIQNIE